MKYSLKPFALFITMLFLSINTYGYTRFTNYVSPITTNAIYTTQKTIWIASSGGVFALDKATQSTTSYTNASSFPDPDILSLSTDGKGGVWAGSKKGYLYHIESSGMVKKSNWYHSSNWDILCIERYNDVLLIGSSKGFSIFDPRKDTPLQNATAFGTLKSYNVNALTLFHDSLFVATAEGVVSLPADSNKLLSVNLYDRNKWNSVYSGASIKSFSVINNSLVFHTTSTCTFKNRLVESAGREVKNGFETLCTVNSPITTLASDGDSVLYIGTSDNYFFVWNQTGNPVAHALPGPILQSITKIGLDKSGTLWVLPQIPTPQNPPLWWVGIESFSSSGLWKIYNYEYQAIGTLGSDAQQALAVFNDKKNAMWFGTGSGNIKKFNAQDSTWSQYFVSGKKYYGGFRIAAPNETLSWGMCNAIAQDTSGYLWIGSWDNYAGSLICYNPLATNPTASDYKRFFGNGLPYSLDGTDYTAENSDAYLTNVTAINVDAKGKILAGSINGKLIIFSHTGSPLTSGVSNPIIKENLSSVNKIVSVGATSFIATGNGLYSFNSDSSTLRKSENVTQILTSAAALSSDTTVWLGTANAGIIHYSPKNDSILEIVNETNGLLDNVIKDLAVDLTNGYLWIATSAGIARYFLGQTTTPVANNKSAAVFPNPYKKNMYRNVPITFQKIVPFSKVSIYTSNGQIVGEATPSIQESSQWTFSWTPSPMLVNGTYLYSIHSGTIKKIGKILLCP